MAFNVAQLGFDLGLRQGAVCGEIDEVCFTPVQTFELSGQLLVQQASRCFLVADGFGDVSADVRDEARTEADSRVVPFDGVLNVHDVDVGCVAGILLTVAAEEVEVLTATPVDCPLEDHPLHDALLLATSAEEGALEVVVVDTATLPGDGPSLDDVLDAFEQALFDE
nr:hypothetical protein [Streptomyces sp. V3I8]